MGQRKSSVPYFLLLGERFFHRIEEQGAVGIRENGVDNVVAEGTNLGILKLWHFLGGIACDKDGFLFAQGIQIGFAEALELGTHFGVGRVEDAEFPNVLGANGVAQADIVVEACILKIIAQMLAAVGVVAEIDGDLLLNRVGKLSAGKIVGVGLFFFCTGGKQSCPQQKNNQITFHTFSILVLFYLVGAQIV